MLSPIKDTLSLTHWRDKVNTNMKMNNIWGWVFNSYSWELLCIKYLDSVVHVAAMYVNGAVSIKGNGVNWSEISQSKVCELSIKYP